jgi:hypothetical protein
MKAVSPSSGPVRLAVPYYAQTSEFSCGPASLLMAMKHLDPGFRMTRASEYEVWRDCNMAGVRGADSFGLAVPLLRAGHEVRLLTARRAAVDPDTWKRRLIGGGFSAQDADLALFVARQNGRRALGLGLEFRRAAPTVARVQAAMRQGFIALALVHMGVVHQYDIPHWVVVSGVSSTRVTFNDPYPPAGRKGLHQAPPVFQRMMDDVSSLGMTPAVVLARRRVRDGAG